MTEKQNVKKKTASNLYSDMYKYNQDGDHQRALKVANRIIQMAPQDTVAVECKIVCMIHLNMFAEALKYINTNVKATDILTFERLYCMYRNYDTKQAWDAISQLTDLPHRIKELKAQIAYRMDNFDVTLRTYEDILKKMPDDEYNDERITNYNAAASFLKDFNGDLSESTFEECFNKAILYARKSSFVECEKLLKKAAKLLTQTGSLTSEEIEADMANVSVLQAYCAQKTGRLKEAQNLYSDILKMRLENSSLTVVSSNNVMVLNKTEHIFDSKKKIKAFTDENLSKLPTEQKWFIKLNLAIFQYHLNNNAQSKSLAAAIETQRPEFATEARILHALNEQKLNKSDPVDVLLKYKCNSESETMLLKLTCVHILLTRGNKAEACKVLENLGEFRYQPGVVGALITLYMSMGSEDVALDIFRNAIAWYKSRGTTDGKYSAANLANFYVQAAEFHLRNGRPQIAAESLEQLLLKDPEDKKALAQLVIAYASFDDKEACKWAKKLGPIDQLYREVDEKNLESSTWLTKKQSAAVTKESPQVGSDERKESKKKKNRKKKRLPKDYDSSVTPDPERWLPKYERSNFRKKRDRRHKDIIKGSQGASTSNQADQYDYSKITVEAEESPQQQDGSSSKGGRPKKGGSGHNKKKSNKRR